MATHDAKARLVQVGPVEVLALELTRLAAVAAAEALRGGGYLQPSQEEFLRISAALSREAHAAAVLVGPDEAFTDAQLHQAALVTGFQVVAEVLGPPRTLQ